MEPPPPTNDETVQPSPPEAEPPPHEPEPPPRDAAQPPPTRKGSALRRQLATQRADSAGRWQGWLRRRLSVALVALGLGVVGFFALRGPALRALAASDGDVGTWAADQLAALRDPDSFGVYVHQLGLRDEREAYVVLVHALAGRDELPAEAEAELAPPSPEAEVEHRQVILEGLTDPDPTWQRGAIYALLTLHDRGWLVDDDALEQVARLLGHADPVIRRWAAMLLAWSVPPASTHGALARAALAGEPDPRVRRYAVQALGQTKLDDHRPTLMRALSDEASEVRREATLALSFLGGPVPLDALERMLRDSDPGQRPEVLTAIANDDGPRATRILVGALDDEDTHVGTQITSARLLAERPAADARAALAAALASADASVRMVAAQGLAEREDGRQARGALVDAFARRVAALADPPTVESWNELVTLHETLRAVTGAEAPTLTDDPASWRTALAAWREVDD